MPPLLTPPEGIGHSNGHADEMDAIGVHNALAVLQGKRNNRRDRRRAYVPRHVPNDLKTGHAVVDAIACIRLQGIVVDWNWLKHPIFQNKNGKPNLTAILVWADLVDWYRPKKRRAANPDESARAEKQFDEEWLVKTYARWAHDLGLAKGQVEDAVTLLCNEGLAEKRPASKESKAKWTSKLGNEKPIEIWPVPSRLREITGRGDVSSVPLADAMRTGNEVCDEMLQIQLKGDVIDFNWLVHPKLRAGANHKLNITALFTFANLFFLHTPSHPINPKNTKFLPSKTKFDGDNLVKSYEQWAEDVGMTPRQLSDAVSFLCEEEETDPVKRAEQTAKGIFKQNRKLIRRWVDTINLGEFKSNLLAFITLNVSEVLDLTFGPYPESADKSPRLFPISKVPPKKRETPDQMFLLDEKSATEKTGGLDPTPVFLTTRTEKTGDLTPKKREASHRKNGAFIEAVSNGPYIDQQQQHPQNVPVIEIGGGGFDANASGDPQTEAPSLETEIKKRREAVIEKLLSFQTGCSSDTIRRAAYERLEHAELWAQWWEEQPEATERFWLDRYIETGKRGDTGRGLALRLNDLAQIPPQVKVEREQARRRELAAERRRQQREQEDEKNREEREIAAYQRKVALGVLRRFQDQGEAVRKDALAEVGRMSEFLVARAPQRDLRKLVQRAIDNGLETNEPLLFALTSELGTALDNVLRERPQLPGLEQHAAGEELDEEFENVPAAPTPTPRSMVDVIRSGTPLGIITELVRDVRDGMVEIADLDQHRDINYELDEWQAIKARVIAEARPKKEDS